MAQINLFDPTTKIRDKEVFCDGKHYQIYKKDYTPQLIHQVDLFNDQYIHELSPNKSFDKINSVQDLILLLENMHNIAGKPLREITNITIKYGTELRLHGNQSCPEGFLLISMESEGINNSCVTICFSGKLTSDTPLIF
ncbi:hypothetical protein NOVO_00870 [Rickettsiales bacterium Ac37b]|nr:hypothetical protein NOVO_00870 [Rickettsiales bacterium Ac37b]